MDKQKTTYSWHTYVNIFNDKIIEILFLNGKFSKSRENRNKCQKNIIIHGESVLWDKVMSYMIPVTTN